MSWIGARRGLVVTMGFMLVVAVGAGVLALRRDDPVPVAATTPTSPTTTPAGTSPAAVGTDAVTSIEAYERRKDRYIDALLDFDSETTPWRGIRATQGLALLERAERTGDTSRIADANELIEAELEAIAPDTEGGALHHGGPLVLLTAFLRYADRPDLLDPAIAERIKTGRRPDGTVDEAHSLIVYRDRIFEPYDPDGVDFDIEDANPWVPRPTDDYNGTENHKLQVLVAAMLLTEVYADEMFDGRAIKDDTPETDDYWHYFRDAFFRYSGAWTAGYPTDHFGGDVNGEEKDASQYTSAYIQDYWLLRDLYGDPVVRAHAEILLDRTLIDMAEDTVMGMYTGPAGRYYTANPVEGINQNVHVIDYLLFDSLGYELPLDHGNIWGFATWGFANILSSDYGPSSAEFPKAIVDLAIDKEDGYLAENGLERHANWVERDLALGFRVRGRTYSEGQSGGFNVHDRLERGAGLNVLMFYGDSPFQKRRPAQELDGVVARRIAVVRDFNQHHEELKLWIKDGFATVETDSQWLFVAQSSSAGRDVYLAVRPAIGTLAAAKDITDPLQAGTVLTVADNDGPLIWEVSTSEDHPTFDAFKADVEDNDLTVTDEWVTYESSALDVEVAFDRVARADHEIDGRRVDWTRFDHGFQTPWSSNLHGSFAATLDKGGYRVSYDWDPDNDGTVGSDEMPVKVVDNG